nr:E3 ubiquitin-protein ligase RNF4-like [Anolis sagrei ordinatus]
MSSAREKSKCRKCKKDSILMSASPTGSLDNTTSGYPSETSVLPTSSTPLLLASAGSSSKAGSSILKRAAHLNDSKEMNQEELQRKHYGEKRLSLQTRSQNRMAAAAQETAPAAEPTELGESVGEEVIDLTCESSVINDSVVFVEETRWGQNQEFRNRSLFDSCILCSDDDDDIPTGYEGSDVLVTPELPNKLGREGAESSLSSGIVRCPICMDDSVEIVNSGRLVVSTECGHIFCSECLSRSLNNARFCPTCREELNHKQYHPIYI